MPRAKVWTLDDGSHWTAAQVAAHTGIHVRTAYIRLHRSRRASYVLMPHQGDEGADGFAVCLRDKNSAPDGFWFVGAYGNRKVAEKHAKAQGKSGFIRPFKFLDEQEYCHEN